jgi:hypothetical protein
MTLTCLPEGNPQYIDVLNEQPLSAIRKIDREEEAPALDKVAARSGHT